MAQVVMTDIQKDLCFNDPTFRQEVKWAIRNKAAYWKGLDGTAIPGGQTAANLKRWAQSRALAAVIQNNPGMTDSDQNVNQFLIFAKNMTVWDNVANTVAACVTYMLTNSTFDTLADNWFDNQITNSAF